jgi:hypothetical protein
MPTNGTRRNKNRNKNGGGNGCGSVKPAVGGKRKTRKQSKGATTWVQSVMKVFKELKAKNPASKFRDALKEASKRKKAGNL